MPVGTLQEQVSLAKRFAMENRKSFYREGFTRRHYPHCRNILPCIHADAACSVAFWHDGHGNRGYKKIENAKGKSTKKGLVEI
jgi:hypothetical protein